MGRGVFGFPTEQLFIRATLRILNIVNAPHFQLMQNRRRIRAGYSPNSFFKAVVVHKTGCAVCAIYAYGAGTAAHCHKN